MGVPVTVCARGVATVRPSLGGSTPPTGGAVLPLEIDQTYDHGKDSWITVTAGVGAPLVVPLEGIVNVRFLGVEVKGGTLTLLLTSPQGIDQAATCSDRWMVSCPEIGSEYTAVKMYAPAGMSLEVRYVLAGDAS